MSGPFFSDIKDVKGLLHSIIFYRRNNMGRILKKRSVMILLALMLIMGLAPMTASAAPAESVTVGGVTMDSGNQYAVLLQPMEIWH